MIAAVSPAAADLEETVSTLRFASSVKLIKVEATCNQINKRDLVSELQTEIERQKSAMAAEGLPNKLLQERVLQLEALCDQYRESIEQDRLNARELAAERKKALEDLGLSVGADNASISVDVEQRLPYLVNLSEDPFLEGCLMYFLKTGADTTVGSAEGNKIRLSGLGVAPWHCTIRHNNGQNVVLRTDVASMAPSNPSEDAPRVGPALRQSIDSPADASAGRPRTLVNGRRVTGSSAELRHQDRIVLGHGIALRLVVPGAVPSSTKTDLDEDGSEHSSPWHAEDFTAQAAAEELVDEADLISQHVRPEEGLEFRLQMLTDVGSSGCSSQSPSRFRPGGVLEDVSPELVVAVVAAPPPFGDAPKRALRFVWSFEKFQSRLQVMRDIYEEYQKFGLEEVRRRLHHEPYLDPWKEIGTGEVQMLLQGLQPPGTSLAEDDPPLAEEDPCGSFAVEAPHGSQLPSSTPHFASKALSPFAATSDASSEDIDDTDGVADDPVAEEWFAMGVHKIRAVTERAVAEQLLAGSSHRTPLLSRCHSLNHSRTTSKDLENYQQSLSQRDLALRMHSLAHSRTPSGGLVFKSQSAQTDFAFADLASLTPSAATATPSAITPYATTSRTAEWDGQLRSWGEMIKSKEALVRDVMDDLNKLRKLQSGQRG